MAYSEFDESPEIDHHDLHVYVASNARIPPTGPESIDLHDTGHASHYESLESGPGPNDEDASVSGNSRSRRESSASGNNVQQSLTELHRRVLMLERQLATASSNAHQGGASENMSTKGSVHGPNVTFENGGTDYSDELPMIPRMVARSWSEFENKYATDECEYAIEVLVGEPVYRFSTKGLEKSYNKRGKERFWQPEAHLHQDPAPPLSSTGVESVPERIRINSPRILNILAAIDPSIDATEPIIMLRPFKFLLYHEGQIRDGGLQLQGQLGEPATLEETFFSQSMTPRLQADTDGMPTMPQDTNESRENAKHMQCLCEFIDKYIKPTNDRLDNRSYGKVRFCDLWYLFITGENIYMPLHSLQKEAVSVDAMKAAPETFQTRYNMIWRLIATGGGRVNISDAKDRHKSLRPNPFSVNCYYIDFDGKYFCPIIHTFSIMPYKGERDITSLEFYPVRFMQASVSEPMNKGKMTFESIASSFTHFYYEGPTLVVHPCGCPLQKDPLHQENIESEVIVDFRMALLKNPSWRPKAPLWKHPPVERGELLEKSPVRVWKDSSRTKLVRSDHDHVYDDSQIERELSAAVRNRERIFAPVPSGWLSNESMLPDNDVGLLPGRVYGFVLRTRTYAPLWLWLLQPIKPQTDGLRNLQLRDNTLKDTVQALVRTHFIQKNAQQTLDLDYDIVRGRGQGLVILLHGAPGVGKTYTAESVAAANGKPLFQITCGDLGLTPGDVEKALKEIFHLAQLWDCVLLLDEFDIFLTERSKTDITRNSLVSVFLRVLEFYKGVLFLTTNRVGVLDDAVKSRITWTAYYPPLDEKQSIKIWKINLKHLKDRNEHLQVDNQGILHFARFHFKHSVERETAWNGRQIQNALKVATSLAEWDAYSQDVQHGMETRLSKEATRTQPTLLPKHFHSIAAGTQAFDRYLKEATGTTEGERAFNKLERADDHAPDDHGGTFIVSSPDVDRNQISSPVHQQASITARQRKSSSATITSYPAHGREPSPRPPPQPTGHRQSSKGSNKWASPSSSRHNLSTTNMTQPHLQRPRSSSQLAYGMDPALPPLRSTRSNSNVVGPYNDVGARQQEAFDEDTDESDDWSEPKSDPADHDNEQDSGDLSSSSREKGKKYRLRQSAAGV